MQSSVKHHRKKGNNKVQKLVEEIASFDRSTIKWLLGDNYLKMGGSNATENEAMSNLHIVDNDVINLLRYSGKTTGEDEENTSKLQIDDGQDLLQIFNKSLGFDTNAEGFGNVYLNQTRDLASAANNHNNKNIHLLVNSNKSLEYDNTNKNRSEVHGDITKTNMENLPQSLDNSTRLAFNLDGENICMNISYSGGKVPLKHSENKNHPKIAVFHCTKNKTHPVFTDYTPADIEIDRLQIYNGDSIHNSSNLTKHNFENANVENQNIISKNVSENASNSMEHDSSSKTFSGNIYSNNSTILKEHDLGNTSNGLLENKNLENTSNESVQGEDYIFAENVTKAPGDSTVDDSKALSNFFQQAEEYNSTNLTKEKNKIINKTKVNVVTNITQKILTDNTINKNHNQSHSSNSTLSKTLAIKTPNKYEKHKPSTFSSDNDNESPSKVHKNVGKITLMGIPIDETQETHASDSPHSTEENNGYHDTANIIDDENDNDNDNNDDAQFESEFQANVDSYVGDQKDHRNPTQPFAYHPGDEDKYHANKFQGNTGTYFGNYMDQTKPYQDQLSHSEYHTDSDDYGTPSNVNRKTSWGEIFDGEPDQSIHLYNSTSSEDHPPDTQPMANLLKSIGHHPITDQQEDPLHNQIHLYTGPSVHYSKEKERKIPNLMKGDDHKFKEFLKHHGYIAKRHNHFVTRKHKNNRKFMKNNKVEVKHGTLIDVPVHHNYYDTVTSSNDRHLDKSTREQIKLLMKLDVDNPKSNDPLLNNIINDFDESSIKEIDGGNVFTHKSTGGQKQ